MKKAKFFFVLFLALAAMLGALTACTMGEPGGSGSIVSPGGPGGSGNTEGPSDTACVHATVFHAKVEAQCETAGSAEYWECSKCGKLFGDQTAQNEVFAADLAISPLGHDLKGTVCAGQACTRCDYRTEGEGHKLEGVVWTDKGEPQRVGDKCDYEGTHTAVCPVCGETVEEAYTLTGMHKYITRIGRAATCIKDGTVETVCSVCGEVAATRTYTDGSAHNWGRGMKTGNVTTYTCQNNLAHVKKAIVSDMGATYFTKEDLSEVDEITVSGVSVSFDAAAEASLPAGRLSLSVKAVKGSEIPPTVKEKLAGDVYDITLTGGAGAITVFGGGKATVRLPYSPKAGDDLSALIVYYIDDETLDPISATYASGFAVFETTHFTQFAVGMYEEDDACEMLGHVVIKRHTQPTCTEEGKSEEVCARCGVTFSTQKLDALGHKESAWGIRAPTCTEDGVKELRCLRCDELLRSEILAARGYHVYDRNGKCVDCDYQCPHTQRDGSGACIQCKEGCVHEFKDGACTKCGYQCVHDDGVDDTHVCDLCHQPAPHRWGLSNFYISRCMYPNCNAECIHDFLEGHEPPVFVPADPKPGDPYGIPVYVCTNCGFRCTHYGNNSNKFDNDDTCILCGFHCTDHKYQYDRGGGAGHCTICGHICPHKQYDSEFYCADCGFACPHDHYTDGICDVCGIACEHHIWDLVDEQSSNNWRKCHTCGIICKHEEWIDAGFSSYYVCKFCETPCTHYGENGYVFDENQICTICGYKCRHLSHDTETAICSYCGVQSEHTWMKGRCIYCFKVRTHIFPDNGTVCEDCGKTCQHTYENGICTKCGWHCTHTQNGEGKFGADDTCSICHLKCTHENEGAPLWENGVCTACGYRCPHEWMYGGETTGGSDACCVLCGMTCSHEKHNQEGKCSVCEVDRGHGPYENGQCSVCGKQCDHKFTTAGECTICHMACAHDFGDGKYCRICGKGLGHDHMFDNGACTFEGCDYACKHESGWSSTPDDYHFHYCMICMQSGEHIWVDDEYGNGKLCSVCRQYCSHGASPGSFYSEFQEGTCVICGWTCDHREHSIGANTFLGFLGSNSDDMMHRCDLCGAEEEHTWEKSEEYHICSVCQRTARHVYDMSGHCEFCGRPCKHQWNSEGQCTVCYMWCPHEQWQHGELALGMASATSVCTVCGRKCEHGEGVSRPSSFWDGICETCGWQCTHYYGTEATMNYGYHYCRICMQTGAHTWTDDSKGKVCTECGQYCDHGVPAPGVYSSLFNGNICSECGFICDHSERDVGYNHFYGYLGVQYGGENTLTHRCDLCGTEEEHQWTMNEYEHTCSICQYRAGHDFMSTGMGTCAQCNYQCTHQGAMEGSSCPNCGMWIEPTMYMALPAALPPKREQA